MQPPSAAPAAHRPRRWWLSLTVAALGLILLVIGGVWLDHHLAGKAWADACAEADRLDPGWRWEDLMAARPVPPDDRNVSVRVQAIRAAMPQKWPDWTAAVRQEDVPPPPPLPADDLPPGVEVLGTGSPADRREQYARELEHGLTELPPAQHLRPGQLAALRAVVAAAADALPKTVGLEDLPAGRLQRDHVRPLLNDLFPIQLQNTRPVAQLLHHRATLLAHDGQADAALTDCRRMLAAARAASAEPMLINALVAMAIRAMTVSRVERVLAQGEPGPAALDQMRRALEAAVAEPLILDGLRGDRAFFEDQVRSVDEGLLTWDKVFVDRVVPSVTGVARIDEWLHRLRSRAWSKRDAAVVLRFQTLLVEIAKESPDALRARADEYAAFRAGHTERLQQEMTHDTMFNGDRRGRALLSSAVTGLAGEKFRRDRGRWPASLDELVAAGHMGAVPADSYDAQRLRFRKVADGVVIYSVGQDLADDGGEVHPDPQVGGLSKDVGVRLWDPARRRRPPPPPAP